MSQDLCSICLENPVKYTCPACKAQTCSATCVKRHKLRSECSGLPDPTKFVPNKDLEANSALVNRDYNYLLTLERKISLAKQDVKDGAKNVFKRNVNTNKNKRPRLNTQEEEVKDKRLELVHKVFPHEPAHSIRRQNTLIIHLPAGMSRATQNKSGYDKKSGTYTWTVDWIPVDLNGNVMSEFTSFRLKENQLLKELVPMTVLTKLFAPAEIELLEFSFYLENCLKPHDLKRSLIALDIEKTLADNLADKVVLEYARICVVHSPSIWAEFVQTEKEIFGHNEDSETNDSSSDSESDLSSDDSDDSTSLELDSDDEPEEASSKLVEEGETVTTNTVASVTDTPTEKNTQDKMTDQQPKNSEENGLATTLQGYVSA
ncbi:hypothetical protein PUMCH_001974 [Australozyma saopauloensis]|uniref:HIT-type domain-containing protein n=1 Tax=Australozyma saopauloensis TaxID=291208 RepID=A0AAX4H8E3_9ASCO|nr:hypothetical protein PUMCH_001974 [[Candida] saopauloensis]